MQKAVVAIASLEENAYFARSSAELFASVTYLESRPGRDQLIELLGEFDALIIGARERIDSDMLDSANHVRTRIVGTLSVGLDHLDIDALKARRINVVNTPTANVRSVAEHNVTLALALAKRLKAGDIAIRTGGRSALGQLPTEVEGKIAGVIGYGKIGSATAKMLKAFGLHVLATSRSRQSGSDETAQFVTLETLLVRSSIVIIAVPLSHETRNIIDRNRLDLMKPGSVLVNTARAELIDNAEVRRRLDDGLLAGFGGDYDTDSYEFTSSPNAIITPHVAGLTIEANDRVDNELIDRIRAILTVQPPA